MTRIFFTTFLILLFALPAWSCIEVEDPYQWYAFRFIEVPASSLEHSAAAGEKETIDFWHTYCGGKVPRSAIKAYLHGNGARSGAFLSYLKSHQLSDALAYLDLCNEFSEAQNSYYNNVWDYDSPADSHQLAQVAAKVKIPSEGKLRCRYIFLKMRVEAALHHWNEEIRIWQSYAQALPPSPLKCRMEGYYAGALYHSGDYAPAIEIFIRQGDNNSVSWCLEKMVGLDQMKKLYAQNPTSAALLYVMQDYANFLANLHRRLMRSEINDANGPNASGESEFFWDDYEPTRDDLHRACRDFIAFADVVISSASSSCPVAWLTAKAMACNLVGERQKAREVAELARNTQASKAERENLQRINLWLMASDLDNPDSMQRMLKEFDAFYTLYRKSCDYTADWDARRDLQPQADYFQYMLQPEIAYHYFKKKDNVGRTMADYLLLGDPYGNSYFPVLDNAYVCADDLCRMVAVHQGKEMADPLVSSIIARINPNVLYDVAGTRLLRVGRFSEAVTYLQEVNMGWVNRQNYAPYLSTRTLHDAPPFLRSRKYPQEPKNRRMSENPKILFCKLALQALDRVNEAPDRAQRADALCSFANLLFQATPQGGMWAISAFSQSPYQDHVYPLAQYAIGIIKEAYPSFNASQQAMLDFATLALLPRWASLEVDWHNRTSSYAWKYDISETDKKLRQELYGRLVPALRAHTLPPYALSCDILRSYARNPF